MIDKLVFRKTWKEIGREIDENRQKEFLQRTRNGKSNVVEVTDDFFSM